MLGGIRSGASSNPLGTLGVLSFAWGLPRLCGRLGLICQLLSAIPHAATDGTFLRSLREAAAARARGARRPTGAEEGEGRMSRPDAGEVPSSPARSITRSTRPSCSRLGPGGLSWRTKPSVRAPHERRASRARPTGARTRRAAARGLGGQGPRELAHRAKRPAQDRWCIRLNRKGRPGYRIGSAGMSRRLRLARKAGIAGSSAISLGDAAVRSRSAVGARPLRASISAT